MKMKKYAILFFFCVCCLLSCSGQHKAKYASDNAHKTKERATDTISLIFTVNSIKSLSLTDDLANFNVTKESVEQFFKTGSIVSNSDALKSLSENNFKYNIMGEITINQDTLCYVIHASGIGVIFESPLKLSKNKAPVYYKNNIDIPKDIYTKEKSVINILCYERKKIDLSTWDKLKEEDPSVYDNELYNSYLRWNHQSVSDMYKAFSLLKKTTMETIRYDYNVNSGCFANGFLIKNNTIYEFWMNGGGVFELFPNGNRSLTEVYGCFTPECKKYFISILKREND